MAAPITVYPEGSPSGVQLTDADHLATGGEASVYLKGRRVFKLYTQPQQAAARGLDRKLALLKSIRHRNIAAPDGLVLDRHGALIGLCGPYVPGEPLCRLFTNTWRDAHRVGPAETGRLVDEMRAVVQAAHAAGAVMADANELNWIADGMRPVAIDVDSWQLPGFPATVVMPSIRDHGRPGGFDEGTDWFAWAVVSFQLWTGIHPYKGTHPGHGRGALEQRMKARASVFEAGVKLPAAARPLQQIPPRLRDWYERMFQTAERSVPPRAADGGATPAALPVLKVLQTSAGALRLEHVCQLDGEVAAMVDGFVVVRDAAGMLSLWDAVARHGVHGAAVGQRLLSRWLTGQAALLRRPAAAIAIELDAADAPPLLRAIDLGTGAVATLATAGRRLWQSQGRAFVLADGDPLGLHELDVLHVGADGAHGAQRLVMGIARRWPVHTLSSTFLRNTFVQDAFGTPVIGVVGADGLQQGVCPSLRGHRVIDGFAADAHNVWLSARRVGDGELLRVRLSLQGGQAHVDHACIVAEPDIDAAVTSAGVGVLRAGDELLATRGDARRTVACAGLSPTLRLSCAGGAILGVEGQQLARLSLQT